MELKKIIKIKQVIGHDWRKIVRNILKICNTIVILKRGKLHCGIMIDFLLI